MKKVYSLIRLGGLVDDEFKGSFEIEEYKGNLLRATALTEGVAKKKPHKIRAGESFYIDKTSIIKLE